MNDDRRHPIAWLKVLLPTLLALLLYHPYRVLPLDVWDFREFLPILDQPGGLWSRLTALIAYYAQHGRMNPLFYATFVVQFGWFDSDPSGWQWLRFVWMSLDTVLVILVARRLGLRLGAGIAAAGLLVTATVAVRGWVQLMAEPQALAAMLAAAYLALGYQATLRWQRSAIAITLLVAIAFLTKEVVGSLGLVVLLLAILWQRQVGWTALLSRRNVVLAGALATVAAGELLLLLVVRSRPEATGYGMGYGDGPLSLRHLGELFGQIILPVRPGSLAAVDLLYPANLLVILALVLGLTTYLRHGSARTLGGVIGFGLLPALIGAAVYLPWPKFDSFYGLPFFVGPLLLYAAAIDQLLGVPGVRRTLALLVAVLVPAYAAIPASRSVETAAASLQLNANLTRLIGRFAPGDSLLVLSPSEGTPRALPVKASELVEYGVALGWLDRTRVPAVVAVPCARFTPVSGPRASGPTYVSYSYGCGRLPSPALRIVSEYSWRDWRTFATVHDTLTIDLLGAAVDRVVRPNPTR